MLSAPVIGSCLGLRPCPHYAREISKTTFSHWKCTKCFPSTLRQKKLKKQQSLIIFGHRNSMIIATTSLSKSYFFKMFSITRKCKAGIFKFLRFEEHFRKSSVFITDLCGRFSGRGKETTNHTNRIPVKWHQQLKMPIWLGQLHSLVFSPLLLLLLLRRGTRIEVAIPSVVNHYPRNSVEILH